MLKLERNDNGFDISLRLRDRERLLSRSFFIALGIALFIHLFWGLLFHIQPFRIGHEMKLYPPAVVDADLSLDHLDSAIFTDLESNKKKQRYHLMPPLSKPHLPTMPLPHASQRFEEPVFLFEKINPFASVEKEMLVIGPKEPVVNDYLATRINLAGPLANLQLLNETDSPVQAKTPLRQYLARYDVQVHEGQIFWFSQKETEGDINLQQRADDMLHRLRFLASQEIIKGTVEIMISEEAS